MDSRGDEVERLRQDIHVLRAMIDAALDHNAEERILRACAAVLEQRLQRLAHVEEWET